MNHHPDKTGNPGFWRWLRGHLEAVPLLGLALFTGLILVFLTIAEEMREGETASFDRAVLLALRTPGNPSDPIGPPAVEELMRDLTALGGTVTLAFLTVAVMGLMWLHGQRRSGLWLLGAVVGGQILSTLAKIGFDRPRPDLVPHGSFVGTASFPSGHSMMAAITYLTLAAMVARTETRRSVRIYLVALALLVTVAVGVSRIYLGVHWPTDVIAGWAAGAGWALFCLWLAERFAPVSPRRRRRVHSSAHLPPEE